MGSTTLRLTTTAMLKLVLLLSVASLGSALNCQECVNEMHGLSFLVKQAAPDIMAYLTANYCPGLEGHEEQCENDLTRNYVQMLFMVVQHFFVDGAQHICGPGTSVPSLRIPSSPSLIRTPARSAWRDWRWWEPT